MLISLHQIQKSFSDETVLKNIDLTISAQDRIGLLGVNGVGKTTLLNIISGDLAYDAGEYSVKRNLAIGYLKQNEALNTENTLQQEIQSALSTVYKIRAEMEALTQELSSAVPNTEQYDALTEEFEALSNAYTAADGYHADVRIQIILNGLGFGHFDLDGKVKTLSGGEKIRFAMAKVLLQNPELLILDEPTNHLDFSMLSWLENYLKNYKGAVLVVSHDRYFLDKVANDICELERGELVRYKGGYSAFLQQKEERIRGLEKAYKKQQEELEAMRAYVRRNLAKSSSTNSVGSRVKALEKMELAAKPNPRQKAAKFQFSYDYEPFKSVLTLENVGVFVGNSQTGKQLYDGVSFTVNQGDKIAIVGQNGVGKTSLLKAILRKLPYTGKIRIGGNVKISYFDQELADLNLNDTVIEAVHRRFPGKTDLEIRSALGRLLIEEDAVFKRIRELSGANRAKVAFCIIMFEHSNFLILDEPTNHLDYTAKEALDTALVAYTGTILTVSHDRYFLSRVPNKMIELFPDGIQEFTGGYAEYCLAKEKDSAQTIQSKQAPKTNSVQKELYASNKKNKAEGRKRRARISALQKEIEAIYAELNTLKAECELPEVAENYVRLSELLEKIEDLEVTVACKENEWFALAE
ncbi:MAG: ABC-F family ATP-binding cassette domain-containing protein [Candidatus Fimenecus sp.]